MSEQAFHIFGWLRLVYYLLYFGTCLGGIVASIVFLRKHLRAAVLTSLAFIGMASEPFLVTLLWRYETGADAFGFRDPVLLNVVSAVLPVFCFWLLLEAVFTGRKSSTDKTESLTAGDRLLWPPDRSFSRNVDKVPFSQPTTCWGLALTYTGLLWFVHMSNDRGFAGGSMSGLYLLVSVFMGLLLALGLGAFSTGYQGYTRDGIPVFGGTRCKGRPGELLGAQLLFFGVGLIASCLAAGLFIFLMPLIVR